MTLDISAFEFAPLDTAQESPKVFAGPRSLKPFHVFLGMPGVGKTHTMIHDHIPRLIDLGYEVHIVSQTTYAVETAANRLPAEYSGDVSCSTLHKFLFNRGSKEHADRFTARMISKQAYNSRPLQVGADDALLDAYVQDAPSNRNKEVERRAKYLATFDPYGDDPIEKWVEDPAIHRSLAYDMTLLRYWKSLRTELDSTPLLSFFRGVILIDEAQDVTPLQSAVLREIARKLGFAIRVYGDPHQQISNDYDAPLFAEVADDDLTILPGHPKYKRVPWRIAQLAWSLDPSMPHWSEWANMDCEGEIRVFDKSVYPVQCGMSLSESRARTRTCAKETRKHQYTLDPKVAHKYGWDLGRSPLFCCIHGAKGWESDVVICQRWLPNHRAKVRRGEQVARNQLFTILTRCKKTLYIHREMLELCNLSSTALARSA